MIRRGRNQPNITRANQFMAGFFDHKPISIKFTSNPKTAERPHLKKARKYHKRGFQVIPNTWWSGMHYQLDSKGRKHLVYVNKNPEMSHGKPTKEDLESIAAHEIFHAQFERHRRAIGKKLFMDAAELATYIAQFEYMLQANPKRFAERHSKASKYFSPASIPTQFGKDMAELIHQEFKPKQRREMIEELKHGHFGTRKQIIKWLLKKLKANGSNQKELMAAMERYLKQ